MSSIKIEGLSERQRKIADIMWMMNSKESVQGFIRSLSQPMRQDAETVMEMMILAVCDECEDVAEAQHYLKPYRLTGL
jgi:hypothetical protein